MKGAPARRHNGVLVAAISFLCAPCALVTSACSGSEPPSPYAYRTASLAATPGDWTTFGHDDARTGKASGPAGTVQPNLPPGSSVRLDGPVYGQPLLVGDTILAATENDSVYAVSALDGSVFWRTHLAEPFHVRNCGNVQPLGITGTPVYDPATRRLYVVAEDADAHHVLVTLDAATGNVLQRITVDPPAGNRTDVQQRPALALVAGHVYAAFGGLYGDCGTYSGAVASVDVGGAGGVAWYLAATGGRGGIWAPGGPPVAHNGLYFSVGNGNAQGSAAWDGSDSVVSLATDPKGPDLKRADAFAPAQWAADNAADADLGSMNPALVGTHILIAGKAGLGYVLDADRLGGGVTAQPTAFDHCLGFGAAAVDGDTAYVPCAGGVAAVRVGADGSASVLWRASAPADGSPVIGGGFVWSTDWSHHTLYALDPATGRAAGQTKTDALPHFASPSMSTSGSGPATRLALGTMEGIQIFVL